MTRRAKGWLVAALLFGVGNFAGAVMALAAWEPLHAATHVVLAILSAYVARALVASARSQPVALQADAPAEVASARLAHLELSLEELAVGVERMGESQRSVTRLVTERTRDADGKVPREVL